MCYSVTISQKYSQVAQVVAYTLNIDLELVSVKPSNNLTAPDGAWSAASVTSEVCAYVSIEMCNDLEQFFLLQSLSDKYSDFQRLY
jgi:xanthine dehydrogenase molybdopterin-binding subunit B